MDRLALYGFYWELAVKHLQASHSGRVRLAPAIRGLLERFPELRATFGVTMMCYMCAPEFTLYAAPYMCQGDEAKLTALIIALAKRRPRPRLLFRGPQGCGKSLMANFLGRAAGQDHVDHEGVRLDQVPPGAWVCTTNRTLNANGFLVLDVQAPPGGHAYFHTLVECLDREFTPLVTFLRGLNGV